MVGHLGDSDVRILRGKGVGSSQGSATGECVIQRGLARIGETDETETFHEGIDAICVGSRLGIVTMAVVLIAPGESGG